MTRAPLAILAALALASTPASRPSLRAGVPPPVVRGGSPAVSPDGRRIAFLANRDSGRAELFVIGADGTHERQLTFAGAEKERPRWTAAGTIQFATFERDSGRLFEVRADGGAPQPLVAVWGRSPQLVDGGARVLFATGPWSEMQWSTSALDGSALAPVTDGAGAYWNAALAPDGRRFAVTHADSARQLQLVCMNLDGTEARAITAFAPAAGRPQCAAWSPDGRRLAFQVNGIDAATHAHVARLWIADADTWTAAPVALAPAGPWRDETPAWFPDGRRLAFQSNRSGATEVWIVNADGSGARQVTR